MLSKTCISRHGRVTAPLDIQGRSSFKDPCDNDSCVPASAPSDLAECRANIFVPPCTTRTHVAEAPCVGGTLCSARSTSHAASVTKNSFFGHPPPPAPDPRSSPCPTSSSTTAPSSAAPGLPHLSYQPTSPPPLNASAFRQKRRASWHTRRFVPDTRIKPPTPPRWPHLGFPTADPRPPAWLRALLWAPPDFSVPIPPFLASAHATVCGLDSASALALSPSMPAALVWGGGVGRAHRLWSTARKKAPVFW